MNLEPISSSTTNDSLHASFAGLTREETAQKFESLLMSLVVKELRQSLPDGLFGKGPGSAVYEGMFDQIFADALASGPGTGLRESILESLPPDAKPEPKS